MGIKILSEEINNNVYINADMINKWNSVVEDMLTYNITTENILTGVIAEKYRYDMEGLLEYLGIDIKFRYPTMRVNGYNSSREYTGDKLVIKIIDNRVLAYYYEMFMG